ncbi:MAG: chromosomal replication initiator protein DnaA [Deltaproteobacteria bacterium]|nr:chromosomal replication initiator protein DnaA [Deltaproteobacteria bacterium]
MSSVWEELKHNIKDELPAKSFSLWINPITFMDEKDNSLVLGCPNKFSLNWIKENYMGIMEETLKRTGNNSKKLVLKVKPSKRRRAVPDIFKTTKQLTLPNVPTNRGNSKRRFHKEFTFDRFVVGNSNEFAYSASKALALGGNWTYDSLFLLANTGLGKSHLSHSIGHAILDHDPKIKAYYITAEDFVNEMIFALKNNCIEDFKNRYRRSCDVLLLEEVHFLSGKEKIQIELGYTLDALANDNKKLIFTSSFLPKDIPNLSKELSSRLTSGIITAIDKPDYVTRVKIIEKKSSEQNLRLSEDISHLFAKHLTRDVRQIESVLRCLRAKSELLNAKIDLDLAKEVIRCHVSQERQISIKDIKKLVCQYFKVDPVMLRSKSRKKSHTYPRNIYIYLCRNNTDATLDEIGKTIDRNHSTVLYSSEVIAKKIKIDNKIKHQMDFLDQKLKDMVK